MAEAQRLSDALIEHLDVQSMRREFEEDLQSIDDDVGARVALVRVWLEGFVAAVQFIMRVLLEGESTPLLDPEVMHPWLPERPDDAPGQMAEMAVVDPTVGGNPVELTVAAARQLFQDCA